MASFSISSSFYCKNNSTTFSRPTSRTNISSSCQNHQPIRFSDPKKKNEEEKVSKIFSKLVVVVEKLGKGLKDSLSPKSKGDWKDVMLMSISFAVYVYISQLLVTAYCSWVAMLKQ